VTGVRRAGSVETLLRDGRGAALPLALLGLLVLGVITIAFATLGASEPLIAANQLRVAQARAAAEAGVERALWALARGEAEGGLPSPLPAPAPAPYDGSTLIPVAARGATIGGVRVSVAAGMGPAERTVVATGWAPSDTAGGKARQRVVATLVRLRFPDPPAALTAGGPLELAGSIAVDARQDARCGARAAALSPAAIATSAPAAAWGADGNATPNEATDVVAGAPLAAFAPHALTDAELATMRAHARARGTYYRGEIRFSSDLRLPNGLVFVDTVSGNPITGATPDADLALVTIEGNAAADPSGVFSGWIVVNGSLDIRGEFQMRGLVYAQVDLSYAGTGGGQIVGAAMSRNGRAGSASRATGGAIRYDCEQARTGGGAIPQTWTIKPGSYREMAG
jgi:hypothetical protein